jgi:hypothetical protein
MIIELGNVTEETRGPNSHFNADGGQGYKQ